VTRHRVAGAIEVASGHWAGAAWRRRGRCGLAASLAALVWLGQPGAPRAEDYPAASITYVVPFGAGGATDRVSRLLAELSEPLLGRKIVIVNRPGASATIGTTEVFRARPDGYTIGLSFDNALNFQPLRMRLPYRNVNDFQPVFRIGTVPFVLAVRADAPWPSLADYVAEARRRPGQLRAAVSGKLTPPDLVAQLFGRRADIDLTTVPFTGGGAESIAALLGGHVESAFEGAAGVAPYAEAGTLRALAVFSAVRLAMLPEVPTAAEQGYDVTLPSIHVVVGPKGLAPAVVVKLHRAFSEAWRQPRFQAYLRTNGYVPVARSPGPDEVRAELEETAAAYLAIARLLSLTPQ
jgi:tripartite-type tricarboxylate transporter receptor subunit TctC